MKARMFIFSFILAVALFSFAPATAQLSNPEFGMQAGTVFSTSGPAGSLFTNSLAPNLNFGITKDFHLEVGTIFSTTRFNGFTPHEGMFLHGSESMLFNQPSRMHSTTMYAFGVYRVNPKLSISGGTWFERTQFDMSQTNMNPYASNYNPKGMMLGLDYRVTENLRFGVEVSASSGMSPFAPGFYQHQASPGGFYNHNPFHRYSRW